MSYAFDEGRNTRKNDAETYYDREDPATSDWLRKHKLHHLIPIFAEECITIEELVEMGAETLNTFLDELVDDDSIKFKKRDKIRIKSKLKPREPAAANTKIVTEAEMSAFDSLDKKYKQLSSQERSIQYRLSEFEAEYVKQQKILNTAFAQIVSNVQQRQNVLLNQMKQKRDEYKDKLGQRMESVANQRSLLNHVKNKCEQDITDSAATCTTLQAAQKRANAIVQMIDETLLSVQQHEVGSDVNRDVYVKFDIANKINDDIKVIKQWGDVSVVGDKPPVPVLNVLNVSWDRIVIEMLCDESYTGVVSKYECQYKVSGAVSQNPAFSSSDDELFLELKQDAGCRVMEIVSINDKNVAFLCLTKLEQHTIYNIRVRAVRGDWSEWSVANTKLRRKGPPKGNKFNKLYRNSAPFPIQKTVIKLDEWYQCCEEKKITLSLYELQRVFSFVKFMQAQGQNMITDVQGFSYFLYKTTFISTEWKELQTQLRIELNL